MTGNKDLQTNLSQRIETLKPLIFEAGEYAEKKRQSSQVKVEIKEDKTPVTNVDYWANQFFKEKIEELYPGEIYIGEEDEILSYTPDASPIWYVDPIDGTRQFIDGTAPYFILIGLVVAGKPVLGMVYEPEKKRLIYGYYGGGAFVQWERHPATEAQVKTNWNAHLPIVIKGADRNFYHKFEKSTAIRRIGHIADMHNALAPVEARTQGMVSRRKTWLWDFCAPAAIMAAAGYRWACYKDGREVLLNFGETIVDQNYILPPDTPEHILQFLIPQL